MLSLGGKPLSGEDGALTGSIPYQCGYVLSAAAESGAVKADKGDIATLWRAVFSRANDDGHYQPQDFLSAAADLAGPDYQPFADYFLKGEKTPRWSGFAGAAEKLGWKMTAGNWNVFPKSQINNTWLGALMKPYCPDGYGFIALMIITGLIRQTAPGRSPGSQRW